MGNPTLNPDGSRKPLGQIAYEAWRQATIKTFEGKVVVHSWDELSEENQEIWSYTAYVAYEVEASRWWADGDGQP